MGQSCGVTKLPSSWRVSSFSYYKRVIGVHQTTHTQAVRGDIWLFSLRKYRIGQMFRFWRKVLELPDDRLVKIAYLELVKLGRKKAWPSQIHHILNEIGLSYLWNEGLGAPGLPTDIAEQATKIIEH